MVYYIWADVDSATSECKETGITKAADFTAYNEWLGKRGYKLDVLLSKVSGHTMFKCHALKRHIIVLGTTDNFDAATMALGCVKTYSDYAA